MNNTCGFLWRAAGLLPAVLLCGVFALAARAAPPAEALARTQIPGESPNAAQRLMSARKLAAGEQYAEAVAEYQGLLEEVGDKLVPLGPQHSVQARWLCHLDLAALPPAGLKVFRNRVDGQAKKWFEQGAAERDVHLLRRVIDEAFCSRWGDPALDLLGDLAFEGGRFEEAERWWRLLARPVKDNARPADPLDLVFPDPQVDVAGVRAKQLLARLFRGEPVAPLRQALASYRQVHDQAEGHLAGRKGKYAGILQTLLDQSATVIGPPKPPAWTTFAGDPSRQLLLPAEPADPNRLLRLCRSATRWRFSLEKRTLLAGDDMLSLELFARGGPAAVAPRSLAFYPVFAGNQVLVADARYVTAYDLVTGKSVVWHDGRARHPGLEHLELRLPARPDLRYSLTVAGDEVYARLGTQALEPPEEAGRPDERPRKDREESYLVCLRLQPDKGVKRLRWEVRPEAPNQEIAVFEGAPVVADGRVFAAVMRFSGARTVTAIHCYAAEAEDTSPLRWRQDVCETGELKPREQRVRHHLLTLAGSNVVYCSHSGAVVALDAATGKRAWAVRYPSRGAALGPDEPSPRDLAPALYAEGRLFVAPADYDHLLCLDAITGRLLWERDKIEVVHLLGVGRDRLIVTTPTGIRAVVPATGDDAWLQPADGTVLPPFGRGFLAGELVFWPTRNGVYVLNQADGEQPTDLVPGPLRQVRPGNMVYANGSLAVADAETLTVYPSPALLRERRAAEAQAEPGSGLAHYQLALAEAAAGSSNKALTAFERAGQLARPGECWDSVRLEGLAEAGRQDELFALAEQAREQQKPERMAGLLAEAAVTGPRLEGRARLAQFWTAAGEPVQAAAAWQMILDNETLRAGRLLDDHGNPQRAQQVAAAHVKELIRRHGAGVYEEEDKRAQRILANSGEAMPRAEALQRLVEEFPTSRAAGPALLELAHLHEQAGHVGAADHAYRLLLRSEPAGPERAQALQALARNYERQHCCATDAIPHLALPLVNHGWQATLALTERLLPSSSAAELFFADGNELLCREADSGRVRWRRTLRSSPDWVGRHADLVVAAGPWGVHALTVDEGVLLWDFAAESKEDEQRLTRYRLAAGRVFFLQGDRHLVALDAESGQTLWTRWAPAARLNLPFPGGRFFHAEPVGNDRLLLQTSGGRLWLLDARTGETLQDLETSRQPWPRSPLVLDDRLVCVVPDTYHVVLVDAATGKEMGRYTLPATSTLSGEPPSAVGAGDRLLLLVPRNYGFNLLRLDPQTAKPLWPDERPVAADPIAAESASLDANALYFTIGDTLYAQALADGRPLWRVPLRGPGRAWRTLRTSDYLVAYPSDVGARRLEVRGPLAAFEAAATLPLFEQSGLGFPVLFCDAKTGQLVQRLNLNGKPPLATRGGWRLGLPLMPEMRVEHPRVSVQVSAKGLVIALEGQVWVRK
jgi:outer membrane protein assembly factor BamB/tetratricopeptide (TPR) repeat protein